MSLQGAKGNTCCAIQLKILCNGKFMEEVGIMLIVLASVVQFRYIVPLYINNETKKKHASGAFQRQKPRARFTR